MNLRRCTLSLLLISHILAPTGLSVSADKAVRLTDHGIDNQRPEAMLPGNAIVHARIRNIQQVLENLESFALNTIPHQALPPAIQPIFNAENPLLTLLGMPIVQAPLTSEAIAERLGIDSEAEITMTLYPGIPTQFFIASIGMADGDALTKTLSMALGPEQMIATSIGGRQMIRIKSDRLPMGSLYLSCSKNRVYITGEPSLLLHLHEPGTVPTLAEDTHMGEVIGLVKNKDLAVSVNPELIKPFTSQLPFYKYLPLSFLNQARDQFLNQMPAQQRRMIEKQIEQQTGIKSLEEVADYAECLITATYEQIFETIYDNIDGFNGTTFAIRLDSDYPELSFFFHHERIIANNDTQPIPMAAAEEALGRLASSSNHLKVSGRESNSQPSPWVSHWIERTRNLMNNKGLDTTIVDTVLSLHEKTQRPDSIEAKVPWTVQMNAAVNSGAPLSSFDTIAGLVADRQANAFVRQTRPVTIIPQRSASFLRQHFQDQIDARSMNQTLSKEIYPPSSAPGLIASEQRLIEATLPNKVTQLTLENAYISRAGLFGYNQHEFINRKIYLARPTDDYLVFHQASKDATWLNSLDSKFHSKNGFPLQHLVDRLPNGVNTFTAHRGINYLVDAVTWIQDAEALVHRDIQNYLDQVLELASSSLDRESLLNELQSLPYSPVVASVNQDANGTFYCMLPGNITFPRAKITPILGDLIAPVKRSIESTGGLIAYTRTMDGTKEWSIIWNTEGVSSLIQTVGNTIVKKYLNSTDGIQEVMELAINERDQNPDRFSEVLGKNPAWRFLEQIKLPTAQRPRVEHSQTIPDAPIAPRDSSSTEKQIDLSTFYNGSVNETWHQGGIENNDLKALPQGFTSIGGVKYDIRGVVQLTGKGAQDALSVEFPTAATAIPINQTVDQLHFLHACGWKESEGTPIAAYIVNYVGGESFEIPLEYGIHLRDWWTQTSRAEVPNGDIAWIGSNGASAQQNQAIQLYHLAWNNPKPDLTVASVDFVSHVTESAPFLIAITAESN